jgi:hypothetical protein
MRFPKRNSIGGAEIVGGCRESLQGLDPLQQSFISLIIFGAGVSRRNDISCFGKFR